MYGVILTSKPANQVVAVETIDHVDCIPTHSEAQRVADEWRKECNRTAIVYEMTK
jgi:hypothetical protein